MFTRVLFVIFALTASAARADFSYDVLWRVEMAGGVSAANLVRDPATGAARHIVVCERDTGVVCLDLQGNRLWQYALKPPVTAAPAVADLDGDGQEEIIAADSKGNLAVITGGGQLVWKAQVPGGVEADSCPAATDLDGDGRLEILAGDVSGVLSCFSHDGGLRWQFAGDGSQMGPVLAADLYDIPGKEIIVTSHDRHVYALDSGGAWLWDCYFENDLFPNSTPILADVEGDAVPELYIGGGLHHFYRIDLRDGRVALAENVYLHVNNAIAAADLDGDGADEVVFGNKGGAVACYGKEGFRWRQSFPSSSLYAAPVFIDVDGDSTLEVIFHALGGDVHVLDTDGTPIRSASPGCGAGAAPLIGDFDGDGIAELVVGQAGGFSGVGQLIRVKLGVPYRDSANVPVAFAGDRARSGRPLRPKAWPRLAAPGVGFMDKNATGTSRLQGGVFPEGDIALLSGVNTWRFRVENPLGRRLVLLADLTYPDGAVRHYARHVLSKEEQVALTLDVALPGAYQFARKLVDADTRAVLDETTKTLDFAGYDSDVQYLESVVFAGIEKACAAWQETNPRSAGYFLGQVSILKGLLKELAAHNTPDRIVRLVSLRTDAQRLYALAEAGAALTPSGTFMAWETNPWAYFDARESLPRPENRTERLDVSLCVGEYESLALNLTNISIRTLEIRVSCVPGDDASSMPPQVEFRRAVSVPTMRRERVADALPRLDQAGLLTTPSLETAQLWITTSAEGIAPGNYAMTLRLKSVEPDPCEVIIPLDITVHDLALPRPRPLRFCQWSTDGGDLGTDKPEVLQDLVEHGVTVFFGSSPGAECDTNGNLVGEVDFRAHDESIKRLSPHGIVLFIGPQGALRGQPFLSTPWRKAFAAYLRAWAAHMKDLGLGYDAWALYPYDEPSTPFSETTRNLVEVAKLIRETDPSILIYADPTSGTTMETVAMFRGLIDIWCPSSELLDRLGDELIPAAHAAGKEVWFYDAAGRAKTLSTLGIYRWRFWYAWSQDFAGVGWWCYSHHGGADRWDGLNPTGDFFATVYDGPGGVVSSKRWEAAREGVEDYEYLWLLRETVRKAEARGGPQWELAEARALLERLPIEIEATLRKAGRRLPLTPDSAPLYESATRALNDARQRIVDACLKLRQN